MAEHPSGFKGAEKLEQDILGRQRQRIEGQARRAEQRETGAIQRRFAALGGLQSGSAIKQESLARDRIRGQGQESIRQLEDSAAQRRVGREFKRDFANEQRAAAQKFQSGESQLGRDFAGGEAQKGRDFRKELFDIDLDFRRGVQDFNEQTKLRQLDLIGQQFIHQKNIDAANKEAADAERRRAGRGFIRNALGDTFGEGSSDLTFASPFTTQGGLLDFGNAGKTNAARQRILARR